ncbi:hypothetical protein L208DRAFT_351808 [Tricholoma matsutake]|nr:hypothetical protein L208DRAFT_351808 [Tricholoma matsutake 945]
MFPMWSCVFLIAGADSTCETVPHVWRISAVIAVDQPMRREHYAALLPFCFSPLPILSAPSVLLVQEMNQYREPASSSRLTESPSIERVFSIFVFQS